MPGQSKYQGHDQCRQSGQQVADHCGVIRQNDLSHSIDRCVYLGGVGVADAGIERSDDSDGIADAGRQGIALGRDAEKKPRTGVRGRSIKCCMTAAEA